MTVTLPIWADPILTHRRNIARAERPAAMRALRTAVDDGTISSNLAALLADVTTAGDWRADAACRDMDVEVFFPTVYRKLAEPRQVCAACPVRSQCRAWCDRAAELGGVWGGDHTEKRLARRSVVTDSKQQSLFEPDTFGPVAAACVDCSAPVDNVKTKPRLRCRPCQTVEDKRRKMRWHLRNGDCDTWSKWQVSA